MAKNESIDRRAVPIMIYGNKILRESCNEVGREDTDGLDILIRRLWETLEISGGVGLAAPQIDSSHKVFVVDSKIMYDDLSEEDRRSLFSHDEGIKETFINARIVAESEETWSEQEGCLSIPGIMKPVERPWEIIIEYTDRDFNPKRVHYSGYTAKVIQHEYDHTNGILFIDRLPALSRKLLNSKLRQIRDGQVEVSYPVKFFKKG
ncbi:MAG: peptide deformylase [Bacteroidales bacterium]|jgi:peptide deformylase